MAIKKWVSRISTAILTLLLLTVLTFTLSARFSGGTPKIFGFEMLTVLSGSMEPFIHTGSIIAMQPGGDTTRFKSGDVITFHSPEDKTMIITHRIMDVKGTGQQMQYVTKGDNNDSQDPKPVAATNVIGKYANFTIPWLGYFFNFAKSTMGIILLLIIPGTALIIWQMFSLFRTIMKVERDKVVSQEPVIQDPPQHV